MTTYFYSLEGNGGQLRKKHEQKVSETFKFRKLGRQWFVEK